MRVTVDTPIKLIVKVLETNRDDEVTIKRHKVSSFKNALLLMRKIYSCEYMWANKEKGINQEFYGIEDENGNELVSAYDGIYTNYYGTRDGFVVDGEYVFTDKKNLQG